VPVALSHNASVLETYGVRFFTFELAKEYEF
jgi:hypothetical protein